MRYLLDTNIFLWWLNDDKHLSVSTKTLINNPRTQIFISITAGWEISIKNKAGKLPLKTTLQKCFHIAKNSGFEILDINFEHVVRLDKLPNYHKDPFDRILIAQAQTEKLTLVTSDEKIWKYKVKALKC